MPHCGSPWAEARCGDQARAVPAQGLPRPNPTLDCSSRLFPPQSLNSSRELKLHLRIDSLEPPEEASGEGVVAGMSFTEAGTVLYSS